MDVKVESATEHPATVCSSAAGCCYGNEEYSLKRLETCLNSGHLSVFEHASATWSVRGISRACSHQLVRHRVASYSQQSQRYCKVDPVEGEWYVTPPELKDYEPYHEMMARIGECYIEALMDGAKPEDARFLLPNACKTDIYVTMNFREFMHFLDLRMDKAAQWEIRELARRMGMALAGYGLEWERLVSLYDDRANNSLWGGYDVSQPL